MDTSDIIENSQALTSVLGYWPSFHDANVVAAARGDDFQSVSIHVFTMTDRVDAKGYFELVNHHVVELLFNGVEKNTLPHGYSSDCLDHLAFSGSDGQVRASFQSHLDGDGDIVCKSVRVVSVTPCTSSGEIISPNSSLKRTNQSLRD